MATLGNLVVNLTANTAQFRSSLNVAESVVTKLSAAAVAMGGVVVARLATVGDMFDKMSKRTGLTVEELSRFKFAGEQSGTSIQSIEGGLRKMNMTLLNADRGLSTATDTLSELGLSMSELRGQTQTQQFAMFAGALKAIEDPGRRAALTMQVFGRAGTELIPLIMEGADGFANLSSESDALGNTVTALQAKLGAELTDALNRVKVAADGLFRRIAEHLAPSVSLAANAFAKLLAFGQRFGKAIVIVGASVLAVATAFKVITLAQIAYAKAAAVAAAFTGPAGWKMLAVAAVAAGVGIQAVTYATKDLTAGLASVQPQAEAAIVAIEDVGDVAGESGKRVQELQEVVRAGFASTLSPVQEAQDKIESFRRAMEATNALGGETLLTKFVESEAGFTTMIGDAQEQLAILRGEATKTGIELARMLEIGVDPARVAELQKLFDQQEAVTFWNNREAEMQAQADAIYAAIETPAQKLAKEQDKVKSLVNSGLLTRSAADEYIAKQRSQLFPEDATAAQEARKETGIQFAGAMQRGSVDAFKAILGARKDPAVNAIDQQTKTLVKELKPPKPDAPNFAPEFP